VGDIIVQAPLLLVDTEILTTSKGCRIYATGTVFIQGSLSVIPTDSSTYGVIQISSASGIVFGYSMQSLGTTTKGTRSTTGIGLLDQSKATSANNPYLTALNDAAPSASAALNSIAYDAAIVGLHLTDASNAYATGTYSYAHIALNAPYVFSNYAGMVTGAMIAEIALFTQLSFTADPALVNVPFFPMYTGSDVPLQVSP
jgi:hypothetical protein